MFFRRLLLKYALSKPSKVIMAEDPAWGPSGISPLVDRFYVGQLFGRTIFLHHLLRSDPDRGVHDHPYDAMSIILAGRYHEERMNGVGVFGYTSKFLVRSACQFYILRKTDFHRVHLIAKRTAWTLFIVGPHEKMWGFLRETEPYTGQLYFVPASGGCKADREWWKTAPILGRNNPSVTVRP